MGLSLEEINGLFGDEVAVHFSDIQGDGFPQHVEVKAIDEKRERI